jgi:hypothetical protein
VPNHSNLLHEPVVVASAHPAEPDAPRPAPLAYSSILAAHRYNSRVLLALGLSPLWRRWRLGRLGAWERSRDSWP